MVRRFSSLFFRQSSQDSLARPVVDNVQTGAPHPGVTTKPLQRTDFSKKTVRHVKSSGALLSTLRSLQYNTQSQTPQPPLPAQSARGLGELQEYFWLEDSLHRTTSQLDRCSNQLDQIHGSAAEVRRELEDLQTELEILQKKMQNGLDQGKSEESREESPRPVEYAPKRIEPVKAGSTQQDGLDHVKEEEPRNNSPKPLDSDPTRPLDTKASNFQPKGADHARGEAPRGEPSKTADPIPRQSAIAKPSSIQQRIQFFSKIASN